MRHIHALAVMLTLVAATFAVMFLSLGLLTTAGLCAAVAGVAGCAWGFCDEQGGVR